MHFKIKRLLLLLPMLLLMLAPPVSLAATLKMGIFPYFSPEQLVSLHKPLKDFLSQQTGQPMHLLSAPDFKTFIQRTAEGRYDILITAPHLGRRAQKQAGYRWLGLTRNYSMALFVTRKDAGIRKLADLAGHTLALPPKSAIIHQMALETLENQGIDPTRELTLVTRNSHDQVLYAVLQGETDAAALGRPTWLRYDAPGKNGLRVIGESAHIPGFAIMIHPRVGPKLAEALDAAVYGFAQTPAGKAYFDKTGLEGIRKVSKPDLEQLDHYLARIAAARKH